MPASLLLLSLFVLPGAAPLPAPAEVPAPCPATLSGVWQADISDRVKVHGRTQPDSLVALRVLRLSEENGMVMGAERAEIRVKGFAPNDKLLYTLVGVAEGRNATLAGMSDDTTRMFHLALSTDGCTLRVTTERAPVTVFERRTDPAG